MDSGLIRALMGDVISTEDPFKKNILEGMRESLRNLGVAAVELANEDSYNNAGKLPFKPDLFFGYNG